MAKYKVLTKKALIKANMEAIRTRREGQVLPSELEGLSCADVFPVTFTESLPDGYLRAQVVLDRTGRALCIDIPAEAYELLPSVEV